MYILVMWFPEASHKGFFTFLSFVRNAGFPIFFLFFFLSFFFLLYFLQGVFHKATVKPKQDT